MKSPTDDFDAVLITSNGLELKVYAIRSQPLKIVKTVNPRNPVPAGVFKVFPRDEGRRFLKDVIDAQK